MGRNKKRSFGEGRTRKAVKKMKIRETAISKAQAILGVSPKEEEEEVAAETEAKEGYETTPRKSERYEAFYKLQNLVAEDEFQDFLETLRKPLPVTFRITGYKGEAQELLKIIKGKFFQEMLEVEVNGEKVPPPKSLTWYPGELAWQLEVARSDIRHCETLKKLHKFMIAEQEGGHITRQEAVSMIPPLLLDVRPHHRVIDLCAAPGSKTAQIIELLHGAKGFGVPEGFVVANDADNKRCYLLVHQAKRLQSPSCLIMNADASLLPNLKDEISDKEKRKEKNVYYDRVLCDVPCSGDGTLRKNVDVWKKWTPQNGNNLHGLQRRILWRGLEVLSVGGRLVYSTCSLNPVEDEAVVAAALRAAKGAVQLVDVEGALPGLKYAKGVDVWKICSQAFDVYSSASEVDPRFRKSISASMFPPTKEEKNWMNLNRCMRILPHLQNTGGFFVAVLEKLAECPRLHESSSAETSEKDSSTEPPVEVKKEILDEPLEGEVNDSVSYPPAPPATTEDPSPQNGEPRRSFSPPPDAKVKNPAFAEDPFVFLSMEKDAEILENIKRFYGFDDDFPLDQLFCRNENGPRRSLYLVTKGAKDAVARNMKRIKFINMGVRVFERQDNKDPSCSCKFRLTQDGVPVLLPFLKRRVIPVVEDDLVLLLTRDEASVPHADFSAIAREKIEAESEEAGSVAWLFRPGETSRIQCELVLAGWLGRTTGRIFVHRNERVHFLQLLGVEWESLLANSSANRKQRVKMTKAAKRSEARRRKREEREGGRKEEREEGEKEGGDEEEERNGEEVKEDDQSQEN